MACIRMQGRALEAGRGRYCRREEGTGEGRKEGTGEGKVGIVRFTLGPGVLDVFVFVWGDAGGCEWL